MLIWLKPSIKKLLSIHFKNLLMLTFFRDFHDELGFWSGSKNQRYDVKCSNFFRDALVSGDQILKVAKLLITEA